jgi:hypothetical protein
MKLSSVAARSVFGITGAAVAAVVAWWGWLGSDTTYQMDPVTGVASGPYEPAQVIGCGVTLVVIAALAALVTRPGWVTAAVAVPFTVAWSVQAASSDETGLWGVGAVLVLVGTTAGAAVGAFTSAGLARRVAGGGSRQRTP